MATVPQGAVTGPVTVSVNGHSATSRTVYVVRTPSIASFSPALADPGTAVTVLGSNFNLIPGSTAFTVGGMSATLNSATNKQAVIAAPNVSGLIGIDTPYGSAVSSTPLAVVPPNIATANVISFTKFVPGAPAQTIAINQAGKHVALRLDATVGQVYSIHLTSMNIVPSTSSVQFTVYSPSNTVFHSAAFSPAASAWIQVPQIPAAGTYLVTVTIPYTTSSVQLDARLILQPELTPDGAPIDLTTTSPGEQRRYSFQATDGDNLGLALVTPATTAWAVTFAVKTLNGTAVPDSGVNCFPGTTPGCAVVLRNLPAGYYSIELYPIFPQDVTFSGTLRFSRSVDGSLADGPNEVSIATPGQNAALTFTTDGTESVAINLRSVVTTPANRNVLLAVYSSSGGTTPILAISPNSTMNLPDLPSGAYTVVISPANAATATMQVTLGRTPKPTLVADGSSSTHSTSVLGQALYFTFDATAGQSLGVALTGVTFSEPYTSAGVYLRHPGGTEVAVGSCYVQFIPGCPMTFRNLPATGTYRLRVIPSQQATLSFGITLTQHITGTLTSDEPLSLNLDAAGRQALITFTNPTVQNVALNIRSIATVPSGKLVTMSVYNSSGAQVPGASTLNTSTAATMNLPNLAAGTYSVLLVPEHAATGTMQLAMATSDTQALTADGSPVSFTTTLPGQSRYFTFSATAGQSFGLALTNLLHAPAGGSSFVQILQPNNNGVDGGYGNCSPPGCQFNPRNLPTSGTYTVRVDPPAQGTMGFTLTLSPSVTGSLTAGSPFDLSLPMRGQHALLTFDAAAGQTFALNVASIATQPTGKAIGVNVRFPNGSSQSANSTTGLTLNLRNLAAGTYSVLIVPADTTTASMQVLLAPWLTGTLVASGTTQSFATTVPGQAAYFSFDATAGQNLGLAVTNLLMSTGTRGRLSVVRPTGYTLTSSYCDVPRCSATASLFNLASAGTYAVLIDPESYATISFDVTLSTSATSALIQGTPSTVTFAAPGQSAIVTFTVSATQSIVLSMSSISLTPANSQVRAEIYRPDGSFLNSMSSASGASLNLNNLAAGTYTVRMVPALGANGTLQLLAQ